MIVIDRGIDFAFYLRTAYLLGLRQLVQVYARYVAIVCDRYRKYVRNMAHG